MVKHSRRTISECSVAKRRESQSSIIDRYSGCLRMSRSKDTENLVSVKELEQLIEDKLSLWLFSGSEYRPNHAEKGDVLGGRGSGNMGGYLTLPSLNLVSVKPSQTEAERRDNEKVGADSGDDGEPLRVGQGEVTSKCAGVGLDNPMLPNPSTILLELRRLKRGIRSAMQAQLMIELHNASELAMNSGIVSAAGVGARVRGTWRREKTYPMPPSNSPLRVSVKQLNSPVSMKLHKPVDSPALEAGSEASSRRLGRGVVPKIKPRPPPTFPGRPMVESGFNLDAIFKRFLPCPGGYSLLPSLRPPPQPQSDETHPVKSEDKVFLI